MSKDEREKEYTQLGRQVITLLEKDYLPFLQNTPRMIWGSFVRGLFVGLGSVIGATLLVAIVLFVLQQIGGLPVVGDFFENISQQVEQGQAP